MIKQWPLDTKMSLREHKKHASKLQKLVGAQSSTEENCWIPMYYRHDPDYPANDFNRVFRYYYSDLRGVLSLSEFRKY